MGMVDLIGCCQRHTTIVHNTHVYPGVHSLFRHNAARFALIAVLGTVSWNRIVPLTKT